MEKQSNAIRTMTWCRQDPFIYWVDIDPIFLSLVATIHTCCFPLSLGSSIVRSNPSQSTPSHCKINRSRLPNRTQISEKKYEAISNHAYKRSKKTQITFMDKNIDLIINSKFIGSQQTHRKKSYIIWMSQRPLYWESKERERKPSSY